MPRWSWSVAAATARCTGVSSGRFPRDSCTAPAVRSPSSPATTSEPARTKFPILLGVDGPPAGESPIAFAFDEASLRGVDLVALHVWALTEVHRFDAAERQRLIGVGEAALAARLAHWQSCYPDVRVDRRLLFGEPAHLLVEASGSAQLTVVGSHGSGGFAEMLLGSVSSEVVRAARTPVPSSCAPSDARADPYRWVATLAVGDCGNSRNRPWLLADVDGHDGCV